MEVIFWALAFTAVFAVVVLFLGRKGWPDRSLRGGRPRGQLPH
jgi:hypothetical protein